MPIVCSMQHTTNMFHVTQDANVLNRDRGRVNVHYYY